MLSLGLGLSLTKAGSQAANAPVTPTTWLLSTGFWTDVDQWNDTSNWLDVLIWLLLTGFWLDANQWDNAATWNDGV